MKIAIAGAGINGLYLAWKLSEAGHKVTVFEKRDKIGKEACSGLFSERLLGFVPQSQALIQNRIGSVLVHFPRKTINVKFKKPFLLMSHAALDRLVAGLAQNAGAEIRLSQSLARNDLANFDRVIGCDGANSAIRKGLSLPDPNFRVGILGFVEGEDNVNFVETWAVETGFIWRIPRAGKVEYGILAKPDKAKNIFDGFLKERGLRLNNVIAAPVPHGLIISKNRSVALCGDAMGLTKPWSGGGVIWGLTAADLILKNFPDFLESQKAIKKRFWLEVAVSRLIVKIVYSFGFHLPFFLPKSVKIDGDFTI